MEKKSTGGFTLPGETGFEQLTLSLAEKWGADVIRDSDGTKLPEDILNAGFGIYSTICVIRDHNDWAKNNRDKLQQTFLCTSPAVAISNELVIPLMQDFFDEQFDINESEDSIKYWQVFDRTTGLELNRKEWSYKNQCVYIKTAVPFHSYTASFFAYRIWEEISMYNHVTNNWDKEHLMQIDPVYPETQKYLLEWLDSWCRNNPATTVIRFTSLFYNFVWVWGSDARNRHLFTDWASYDFTASPLMLNGFEKKYGYALSSEDFINKGKRRATHCAPNKKQRDYMEFVEDFVIDFGKKLVDIVHRYNKLAYVFYDDSWVGLEPYSGRFSEFGFDGIIKAVFSGFEVRLCSVVQTPTHEIRLHPYLFPVNLRGEPTFMPGGDPTSELIQYWLQIRRALLRSPIDRIGLGGYLHLVEEFPDFCDYIEKIANEFRAIKTLHKAGKPFDQQPKIGVLTSWGKLRTWTCAGHYHEHPDLDLLNLLESLSGLPFDVSFLDFDDVKNKGLDGLDVLINAGTAGSAWSGGDIWRDVSIIEKITEWVHGGGVFIGVNQPSAVAGEDTFFRLAQVLGVDEDFGDRICHGKWQFIVEPKSYVPENIHAKPGVYLTDGRAKALAAQDDVPLMTECVFGKGKGIYIASYTHSLQNARKLMKLILHVSAPQNEYYLTDNPFTECACFPQSKTAVIINNSCEVQETKINTPTGEITKIIDAYDCLIFELGVD